ncbi:hypothetical protein AYL99_01248 [Fonsecaea erecta]|uniref:Uncharacterized protein n=1 Tax=Fonsecaea erecta TaxID=1367422 RepID=A0A179A0Z4_9EURO|nr:hypothetical protein AYL99_01248 [Fonsecaea erecta]OAP65276.1 hypothetical protein AYL99_01248 [Fonsecaea erecta]
MPPLRNVDRPGASSDTGNHSSPFGDDGQHRLDPYTEGQKPAPLQSSCSSSPTLETKAKDSVISTLTSQEPHQHDQRQRTPSIGEDPSHDPAIPPSKMTSTGTSIDCGQRTDDGSRSGSHSPEIPPQMKERCASPQNTIPSSVGSSMLLEIGSGFASPNPQLYAPLASLEGEDNRPIHHPGQLDNTDAQD